MDQCVLPQEILDAIVDLSKDDSPTLQACSLASRCLTQRTRVHLFYTILPRTDTRNDAMLNLLRSSPSLATHIRRVGLSRLSEYNSKAFAAIIGLLIVPIHLEMNRVDWSSIPVYSANALCSRTYTSICLWNVQFSSFSELAALLGSSTRLESLTIVENESDTPKATCCDHQHSSSGPPVEHLELIDYDGCEYHILSGINSQRCPVSIKELRSLEIMPRTMDYITQFKVLLKHAIMLKELKLTHPIDPMPLEGLPPLPISHLAKLTVKMPDYHFGYTQPIDWWISNFENTDSNCALEEIHLHVYTEQDEYVGYAHHSEHEAVWDRVAQALSNRMPALRLMEVEIAIDYSSAPAFRGVLPPPSVSYLMNNCIRGKLATLESRGITVEVAVKTPRCLRMYSFIASNSSQSIFVKLRILQRRIPPRKMCNNLLEGLC
ncbi:uncharacterized protein ARMOST_19154 [Armillaria ostoyae]|uniref:F-box domain-containing protein n=1 Tax=Armillaria ostoyae TaxID=47428 RepID=A0A284S3S1_ARMOS|nr:uncharacterized protein ARMOST_19154 [Armillaria ostoyae]